jgi:hypothetical protein
MMAHDREFSPGRLTVSTVQRREELVDYSYDQWRHAQMWQLERNYAEMTGTARKPAAA